VSDSKFPPAPRLPSIPKARNRAHELSETAPPEDDDPIRLMRDVRGACANLGEKISRLETFLMRQELAILTEEHKTNHAHDRLDQQAAELDARAAAFARLVERVAALESGAPRAAE
jgi:hypothetical protein